MVGASLTPGSAAIRRLAEGQGHTPSVTGGVGGQGECLERCSVLVRVVLPVPFPMGVPGRSTSSAIMR